MTVVKGFLIVNAAGGVKVNKKANRLGFDEVAFAFEVVIPTTWGKVQAAKIKLEMPEPPEATVTIADNIVGQYEVD